jgi:hypothetical protein
MAKKPSLRPAVTPTRRGAAAIKRPLPIAKPNGIGETNAETKQKFSVKTEPKITTKIVKLSQRFSIYGNKDAVVKRVYGKNGGDGNLSTDHTRYVEVSGKPSFSYDGKKGTASFKVDFRYYAYEQDAGRKASRDGLEFTKSITVSEKVGVEREVIGLGARNSDNTYAWFAPPTAVRITPPLTPGPTFRPPFIARPPAGPPPPVMRPPAFGPPIVPRPPVSRPQGPPGFVP